MWAEELLSAVQPGDTPGPELPTAIIYLSIYLLINPVLPFAGSTLLFYGLPPWLFIQHPGPERKAVPPQIGLVGSSRSA